MEQYKTSRLAREQGDSLANDNMIEKMTRVAK